MTEMQLSKTEKAKMQKWYTHIVNHPTDYIKEMGVRAMNSIHRVSIPMYYFSDPEIWEQTFGGGRLPAQVTAKEVISKMRDFLASKPKDITYAIFLYYMAYFPVSMCKRKVSERLKRVIGMHYWLGQPTKEKGKEMITGVSMDELAEIFGRSKATIHECVKATASEWREIEENARRSWRLDVEAQKQLLEERKEEIRKKKELETASGDKTSE